MELLKVMFADDEENIRNGLKCILDWEACGYKICGEASNGKDTVNQIIDLRPDLVILDIRMPGCTGIEVIEQVKHHFLQNNLEFPSIIILSGYSDFEYAKQAVNLGAKAFLSKPVDEDELQEKVVQIAKDILEKRNLTESSKNAEILQTKECLLQLINTGTISEEINYEKLNFFENSEKSNYQVIIFDCDFIEKNTIKNIEKSIDNYFSFFTRILIPFNKKILLFLKTTNQIAVQNCLERASKLSEKRTFICLGQNNEGLDGIIDSYTEAKNLEKYLFYISNESFISKDKLVSSNTESDLQKFKEKIKQIIFYIETYDKNNLEKVENEMNLVFCNISQDESITKKNMIYFLLELRNNLVSKYPEREITDGETFDVVPKILQTKTYEESFKYFKIVLDNFIENFNFNTADSVIVKVIAYINNNYSSDLKLEALGDMFNCNSAYLGKKFKKYTGVQFNTYLDNLRIEEAKDKIKNTNLKIYQISKLVGYTNTDYFFMKFKKSTGLTPKEYKKKVDDNEI